MKHRLGVVALICLSFIAEARADIVDIVFGTPRSSVAVFGFAGNETLSFSFGTPVVITAIGWDMTLQTFGGSLASEAGISFSSGAAGPGATSLLILTPGIGIDAPAPSPGLSLSSGGLLLLADAGLPDIFLLTGVLQLEFFETVDTLLGDDAVWNSTITLEFIVIPAPSTACILGLGIAGFRRRRPKE